MDLRFDIFSDCMLLSLLEYLDSTALYQISKVSPRFEELVLKKSLWNKIDARAEPNGKKKIDYILNRVHSLTKMILLKGNKGYPCLANMITSEPDAFKNLTILALEHQNIKDTNNVKLRHFPSTLVEISFKNSLFEDSSSFFRKGYEGMQNLKVLIIDGCINVNGSIIMSISKYPNLEIFSCYKCPIEDSVAYFGIAVSNGFKKIKVFDVRLSGLGNTFLRAFMRKPNVLAIYFRNKDTSNVIDYRKRSSEVSEQNRPVPKFKFNTLLSSGNEENLITDFGTLGFSGTIPCNQDVQLPESYLYTYPYQPCTCGFKDSEEQRRLRLGESESNTSVLRRQVERNFVEIVIEGHSIRQLLDESSESDDAGNSSTERGQCCDNDPTKCAIGNSAIDGNSLLDTQDQTPSRACTEIIYKAFAKKKQTKDQSVGTEATGGSACQKSEETSSNSGNTNDDQPSTSGLSAPSKGRKLSNVDNVSPKKSKKGDDYSDDSSSSSSDEDADSRGARACEVAHPGCSSSSSSRLPGPVDGDDQLSEDILRDLEGTEETDPEQAQNSNGEGSSGVSGDQQLQAAMRDSRDRYRIIVHPRGIGDPHQPARTKVYPCACGSHSVIVVTTDENEGDDDDPPANLLENHCAPQHCEQRINLNAHQSLMVINRNEIPNARPEIQLVDMNRGKPLKCGLKHLSFRGYDRVSDITLGHIEHLCLELLDLTYTRCTKQGILDFLRTNPNCRVLHKQFCVCNPRLEF